MVNLLIKGSPNLSQSKPLSDFESQISDLSKNDFGSLSLSFFMRSEFYDF